MDEDPDTKRVRLAHDQPGHPPPILTTRPSYHSITTPSPGAPPVQYHNQPLPPPPLHHQQTTPPLGPPYREPLPDPRALYQQPHLPPQSAPIEVSPSYGPVNHNSSRSFSSDGGTPRPSSAVPIKAELHRSAPPPQAQEHQHPHMEHGVHTGVYQQMDPHSGATLQNGLPFHPSSEQYAVGQVGGHHSYPPTPVSGFPPSSAYSGPTNYGSVGTRRKQVRAQQACNNCRQRKQKCDESRPCGYCKQENLDCEYREVPPPKTDRTMLEILKKIEDVQSRTEERFGNIERQIHQLTTVILNQPAQQLSPGMPPPMKPEPVTPSQRGTTFGQQKAGAGTSIVTTAQTAPDIAEDALGGHVTGAHHLRKAWPTIREFYERAGVDDEEYVQHEEEKQGPLRLYGWASTREDHSSNDYGVLSPSHGHHLESAAAHTPPEGSRGLRSFGNPNAGDMGGLNPDGSLKVDPNTIRRLHDSYLTNMWVVHPFLDASVLSSMVTEFIKIYGSGATRSPVWSGAELSSAGPYAGLPAKRKRPTGPADDHSSPSSPGAAFAPPPRRQEIEHSVENAVVLLVMALGNILEHDEFLLEEDQNRTNTTSNPAGSHPYNFVKPSPPQSFTSTSFSSAPSPNFGHARAHVESRGSSVERPSVAADRNEKDRRVVFLHTDRIPGIAYFAVATDILGNNMTGNEVIHAQAFLLAGLYLGQLGRVLDSWNWIYAGCRALVMMYKSRYMQLINDEQSKFDASQKDKAPEQRRPAPLSDKLQTFSTLYWSALQLDGDIRAELDRLPPEILSAYTDSIPWPQRLMGVLADHGEHNLVRLLSGQVYDVGRVILHFNAQFGIRKLLNRAHMSLYTVQSVLKEESQPNKVKLSWGDADARMQFDFLRDWRRALPKQLQWSESDDPEADLLTCRLRGKYYGCAYIMTRPFLHHALYEMEEMEPKELEQIVADDGVDNNERPLPQLAKGTNPQDQNEVLRACKRCVNAALKSTVAFDALCGINNSMTRRPRVTNIHGTAAAQFSNILVLAATYKSWLYPLVPTHEFFKVLDRTIVFLRRLTPLSEVFVINLRVVELIKTESLNVRQERGDVMVQHPYTPQAYTPQSYTPQPMSRSNRIGSLPAAIGTSSAHSSFSSNL